MGDAARWVHRRADGVVLLRGDARTVLSRLPADSVDAVFTSPPYWGVRDYVIAGQYGHEADVDEYADRLRTVFGALRRVLRPGASVWINLGDSYGGSWGNYVAPGSTAPTAHDRQRRRLYGVGRPPQSRYPRKSLIGVPWRVAFALTEDAWSLRRTVVWNKPNARPESVRDRLNQRYEWIFQLTADDQDSPPHIPAGHGAVWSVPAVPARHGHIAEGPVEIARRCLQQSVQPGGIVLDPFSGSGTTGVAARRLGCAYVGIDLNPEFHDQAFARLTHVDDDRRAREGRP